MPRAPAATVTVELTKRDVQILRRLILEEARRFMAEGDRPGPALSAVARKIWVARQHVELVRLAQTLNG